MNIIALLASVVTSWWPCQLSTFSALVPPGCLEVPLRPPPPPSGDAGQERSSIPHLKMDGACGNRRHWGITCSPTILDPPSVGSGPIHFRTVPQDALDMVLTDLGNVQLRGLPGPLHMFQALPRGLLAMRRFPPLRVDQVVPQSLQSWYG